MRLLILLFYLPILSFSQTTVIGHVSATVIESVFVKNVYNSGYTAIDKSIDSTTVTSAIITTTQFNPNIFTITIPTTSKIVKNTNGKDSMSVFNFKTVGFKIDTITINGIVAPMPKQSSGNYISTTPIPIIVNYN